MWHDGETVLLFVSPSVFGAEKKDSEIELKATWSLYSLDTELNAQVCHKLARSSETKDLLYGGKCHPRMGACVEKVLTPLVYWDLANSGRSLRGNTPLI